MCIEFLGKVLSRKMRHTLIDKTLRNQLTYRSQAEPEPNE